MVRKNSFHFLDGLLWMRTEQLGNDTNWVVVFKVVGIHTNFCSLDIFYLNVRLDQLETVKNFPFQTVKIFLFKTVKKIISPSIPKNMWLTRRQKEPIPQKFVNKWFSLFTSLKQEKELYAWNVKNPPIFRKVITSLFPKCDFFLIFLCIKI